MSGTPGSKRSGLPTPCLCTGVCQRKTSDAVEFTGLREFGAPQSAEEQSQMAAGAFRTGSKVIRTTVWKRQIEIRRREVNGDEVTSGLVWLSVYYCQRFRRVISF